jgi:hypothetical protein
MTKSKAPRWHAVDCVNLAKAKSKLGMADFLDGSARLTEY